MMETPPFRLARSLSVNPADACCQPAQASLRALRRRVRLAELDSHLHCSIIGTCLSTSELSKLVPKFADIDRQHASDLEIHHSAVELAMADGPGSKALHKALDERYAGAIRRFDQARDPEAVLALWDEARKNGDIPPAYWALMTHPQATIEVRQKAFGELHMLSHLVGAANRADIRRLVALEEENAALKDKVERQQSRLQEMAARARRRVARTWRSTVAQSAPRARTTVRTRSRGAAAERKTRRLRAALSRCIRAAAKRPSSARSRSRRPRARCARSLDEALALHKIMQAECAGAGTRDAMQPDAADTRRSAYAWIAGRRIVYVGGRPGSNAALKATGGVGGRRVRRARRRRRGPQGSARRGVAGRGSRRVPGRLHRPRFDEYAQARVRASSGALLPAAHGERGELRRIDDAPRTRAASPREHAAGVGFCLRHG